MYVNHIESPIDNRVVDLLSDISQAFQTHMRSPKHLADTQLTHFQVQTLAFFARWPGAQPRELVERSMRDKAQIARAVRELEAYGLLKRTAHEGDGRAIRLSLTRPGQKTFDLLNKRRASVVEQMLKSFGQPERDQLIDFLNRMKKDLDSDAPA